MFESTCDPRVFRDVLLRAGYNEQTFVQVLGPESLGAMSDVSIAHLRYLTRGGRPVDTLIQLFLLEFEVSEEDARLALAPMDLEEWLRAGLLETAPDGIRASVRIQCARGLAMVVDASDDGSGGSRPDQVMGITDSTMTLADLTVPRAAARALDLGTGCGFHAMLLAQRCGAVVATDCNARAIAFARFNAAMNGCSNITFLEGDAFTPVAGQKFDLIVCNPPFAISPQPRYVYRDSGLPGDSFCRKLIREAPACLEEGGLFQFLSDCMIPAGVDWKEHVSNWFEQTGCDAWVIRSTTYSPAAYARMWVGDTEHGDGVQLQQLYTEWITYFEDQQVEAISTCLFALRRRACGGPNWVRLEDAPAQSGGHIGESVGMGFALRDFLEAHAEDEALLNQSVRLPADFRLEQTCEFQDGTFVITGMKMQVVRGLAWAGNIDRRTLDLLRRCGSGKRLRDVVTELAEGLGAPFEKVAPPCLVLVRQMIEHGFLVPL
jgi:hypothetical protein